ncbi:hypothetical protein [Streptomyces sp. NPDC046685]|uniref:hypothetical protein n=1 Tax=Streptomyces sp. NPDC046685 TaxID=3157202 RepID=UPI0033F2E0E8
MPSRPPLPDTADGADARAPLERLLAAAVRLARELPTDRPVLGIVRGWSRADRDHARTLRTHLARQGIPAVELSPVPEAGERHRLPHNRPRPRADLLLRAGHSFYDQTLRAAALWDLPLLTERRPQEHPGALTRSGGHRHPVIGARLPDGTLDIAVRQASLTCLQPHPGDADLLLDNRKITTPAQRPVRISLTPDGSLQVCTDTFSRRVRHLRYERTWGICRLDLDGAPAHDVRAAVRLEALPRRLHLLHP